MKQLWIHHHTPSSTQLTLFFAGWGMDEHLLDHLQREEMEGDLMICYDYSQLQPFDTSPLRGYTAVRVVAWSMGVWAASQVLPRSGLPLTACTAWNGTPLAVDDEVGIPTLIFQGTLAGLTERSLQKFRRRMCGSAAALQAFMETAPQRTLADLTTELRRIGEQAPTATTPTELWTTAIIGTDDAIFPPQNQHNAWLQTGAYVAELPIAHYDAQTLSTLLAVGFSGIEDNVVLASYSINHR